MRPRPIAWSRPRTPALLVAVASACLVSSLVANAAAADFDATTGTLRMSPGTLRSYRFESAKELVDAKLQIAKWSSSGGFPSLTVSDATEASLAPLLQSTDSTDAIEGSGYLRLALPSGVAVVDDAFFATVASQRIEVTFWARAEGTLPQLRVLYGKTDVASAFEHASVQAIRTGRETTDGWAEFTTGPVDGAVWGAPIKAIAITGSPFARSGSKASIDALEIRLAPGSPVPAAACTLADVDTTCGAMGDCMFGHCVPSSVTWGPMPSAAHRQAFVERWIQLAARIIGDRNATAFGRTKFTTAARDLAQYAVSSRQFFGGMQRLVNLLRDNHTSFGAPPSAFTSFGPGIDGAWSSGLDACFGVMDADLLGGGRAFGVFKAGTSPATGVALKVGDVLTKIDGIDAKTWVDANYASFASAMPNDPDADWAWAAGDLAALVTARAKNFTVMRCASATSCTGADRQEITVDVGQTLFDQINAGGSHVSDYFSCSSRFHDSVDSVTEDPTGQEDMVDVQTKNGVVYAQFDGFIGTQWQTSMANLFAPKPPAVVMDARAGHGGAVDNVSWLLDLTRGTSEPTGVLALIRGGWDEPDPSDLFKTYGRCATALPTQGDLTCLGAWGIFTRQTAPAGAASKIAWLNTADVSANDFMPRLLQGRSNLRIFGPTHTSGAFGAITDLPALMPGWRGGSIQFEDSRFAAAPDALPSERWESGHGVVPDVFVAQKMSDALVDRDTILEAARAWLSE